MCGICGIQGWASAAREPAAERMNAALSHRGPDDSGMFSTEVSTIAMRRLAIIDLAGGHQPISNEDGTLHIVFNGEIYNYRELRARLEANGRHRFTTNSDTETILHLFEEHRTDTPALLHGMFAFCILDSVEESLFLARDRFGEKPLYYAAVGGALVFASEIASLLECPLVDRQLDREALVYYLATGFVPAPLTMFRSIRQLPPGHSLQWRRGEARIERYFDPFTSRPVNECSDEEAIENVRRELLGAVGRQMISDVPLGAFLSGGIDSSTIVAAMQRQSRRPIKTFTARFEYAPYDEGPIARQVAQHLGTEHHEFVITNAAFEPEDLLRIVRHVGQPFSDSSAIPTYFITRQIRQHVTVCLSGDGGDEMFGGYSFFLWGLKIDRLASAVPMPLLRLLEQTAEFAAGVPLLSRGSFIRSIRRALTVAASPPSRRMWRLQSLFEDKDRRRLQGRSSLVRPELEHLHVPGEPSSPLRQLMKYRYRLSLPEDMLVKVDRMSMANSLEVRAPLLDAVLAEVALSLPDRMLIRRGVTKWVLREVGKPWLPAAVFDHPKTGFSIPLHKFQNEAYRALCEDLLMRPRGLIGELFDRDELKAIVSRGLVQHVDDAQRSVYRSSHQLWALLQLAAWERHFDVQL